MSLPISFERIFRALFIALYLLLLVPSCSSVSGVCVFGAFVSVVALDASCATKASTNSIWPGPVVPVPSLCGPTANKVGPLDPPLRADLNNRKDEGFSQKWRIFRYRKFRHFSVFSQCFLKGRSALWRGSRGPTLNPVRHVQLAAREKASRASISPSPGFASTESRSSSSNMAISVQPS